MGHVDFFLVVKSNTKSRLQRHANKSLDAIKVSESMYASPSTVSEHDQTSPGCCFPSESPETDSFMF